MYDPCRECYDRYGRQLDNWCARHCVYADHVYKTINDRMDAIHALNQVMKKLEEMRTYLANQREYLLSLEQRLILRNSEELAKGVIIDGK